MKTKVCAAVLALATAQALAADSGFATQVTGAVAFKDGMPLAAFTKLRSGDLLLLKSGAKLQLVYFASGRQETWGGRCVLGIGERESTPADCAAPAIKQLPPAVLSALQRTPDMVSDIRNRSGMVRMRSIGQENQVTAAEEQYQSLRAQAAEDDITPELYLFAQFWTLQQTAAMGKVLALMEQRQPGSPEVAALRASYLTLLEDQKPAHGAAGAKR